MARAQAARAQMALAYETIYGTPPVSGFRLMSFARTTLGSEQPMLESKLLGYGRNPLAPIKDAATVDGEVVTVIFANAVTQVGMPQANLTAQLLGLGGALANNCNRLSMNAPPALLLNSAGTGIEATVNKAAGNDAAFAFKTGFSARALIGLLGSDNFSLKVSLDGSAFYDPIRIDCSNAHPDRHGRVFRHRQD